MAPRRKAAPAPEAGLDGTLTRQFLAVELAKEHNYLSQTQAYGIVQTTIELMSQTLLSGQNIEFRDFGVLQVVTRKPRPGRNPRKPEQSVIIPKRTSVRFKLSRRLKDALNAAAPAAHS